MKNGGFLLSMAGAVPAKGGLELMRIVLLNLSSASLEAANAALAGEGYEITIANALTFEEVPVLSPEVLITEAMPSDLSCCGIITQLKSRPETASRLKVLMILGLVKTIAVGMAHDVGQRFIDCASDRRSLGSRESQSFR